MKQMHESNDYHTKLICCVFAFHGCACDTHTHTHIHTPSRTGLLQLPLTVLQCPATPHRTAALQCLAAAASLASALPPLELLFPLFMTALEPPPPTAHLPAACVQAIPAYAMVTALVAQTELDEVPQSRDGSGTPQGCADAIAGHAVQWLERLSRQPELQRAAAAPEQDCGATDDVLNVIKAVAAIASFLLGMCDATTLPTPCLLLVVVVMTSLDID